MDKTSNNQGRQDGTPERKITEWRIIGVSGHTADGRQISAADLQDMAETYNPAVYGARINLEHNYFTFPGWAGGYGDVVELKAEPWTEDNTRTALLARLSVLPNLQDVWDSGEKIYTSMEIMPDFAGSGRAYLVGLAITDTPASLGTTANYTAAKAKAEPGKIFAAYQESKTMPQNAEKQVATATATAEPPPLAAESAAGIFTRLFAKFGKPAEPAVPAETAAASTAPAAETAAKPDEGYDGYAKQAEKLAAGIDQAAALIEKLATEADEQKKEISELKQQFTDLKNAVEALPVSGGRQEHSGASEVPSVGW